MPRQPKETFAQAAARGRATAAANRAIRREAEQIDKSATDMVNRVRDEHGGKAASSAAEQIIDAVLRELDRQFAIVEVTHRYRATGGASSKPLW